MAQELKQSTVNSFVRGLVTEASPLTFPENASVDELNCDIEKTGVRRRRNGIEYEESNVLSSFTVNTGELVHTVSWLNVANTSGVEFLVVQHGNNLVFYDKSVSPISGSEKSFSVDLNSFSAGNGEDVALSKIDGDSINGALVVVSNATEPFYIEYDPETDTISTTQIVPKVRDFEWQGTTSEYFEEEPTSSITDERIYDTGNTGWTDFPLTEHSGNDGYITANNAWPPLTHPWWTGGDPSDPDSNDRVFTHDFWKEVFAGNSLTGNGHFILNLFEKNRSQAVSDDPNFTYTINIPSEPDNTRFTTVKNYAGRMWFSGMASKRNSSKVFFSKVIQKNNELGNFYQEGDPTSEQSPDLVDSDGGVISIPSAVNIKALFEWGSNLLVFAENGVWQISGVDGVFKATEYFVTRIRGAGGLYNRSSLVDAEGVPMWWGNTGIFGVQQEEIGTEAVGLNISQDTIQTFWNDIGPEFRSRAIGVYDNLNSRVLWLYGNDNTNDYKFNKVLLFDLDLRAFVPWTFEDEENNTNYVVGMSYFSGLGASEQVNDVIASGDDVVSDSGTDDVIVTQFAASVDGPTSVRFLVRDGATGKLTFATLTDTSFNDWETESFSSYAVAAYDFNEDLTTRKNNIYVTTYFNLTETGFTGDEDDGYDFLNPSSCILKAFWDLRNTASSSQQVYRHLRPIVVDPGDLNSFDYPYDTIVTRNRVRGRGRTLSLRFESEANKDFQLQGYEVINVRNRGL